jgi:hypothetical protein
MRDGVAVMVLGLLVGGCHPANCPDAGSIEPPDLAELVDADDAEEDAYVSPRRNGPGPELPDLAIDASVVPMPDLAGAPVVDEQKCNDCEKQMCRNVDGNDWYAYCFLNTTQVTDGPGAGSAFSDLCLAVLRCARRTGCAAGDPQACYCGAGVSDVVCLGQPAGPCTSEFEAAAESSHVSDVIDRLSDPSYPVGAAFNLLRYCETPICGATCTPGNLPDGGLSFDLAMSMPDLSHPPDLTPPPDLAIPCADLDGDGKPDCVETLVTNARFDSDVASWSAEWGATVSWAAAPDALGSSSGSLIVDNTNVVAAKGATMAGAEQCVAATAGANYRVSAQAMIAQGQGAGVAGLALQFFPTADCSGAASGAWSSSGLSLTGMWTVISGAAAAPAGTGSLRVRLVVTKPFMDPAFAARFDNVLLVTP